MRYGGRLNVISSRQPCQTFLRTERLIPYFKGKFPTSRGEEGLANGRPDAMDVVMIFEGLQEIADLGGVIL